MFTLPFDNRYSVHFYAFVCVDEYACGGMHAGMRLGASR